MPPSLPSLADLPNDERQVLESWLVEFDQSWDEGRLADRVGQIPPGSSWRLPALAEMVKIDLERQWERGRRISLESYLTEFPELGRSDDVSLDLIQAECNVRRQFGASVTHEDYLRRFPHQAGKLAPLFIQGGTSTPPRPSSPLDPTRDSSGVPKPAATSATLPERFGRYRIIDRLGQGGMGSVYLAEDTQLGRRVALKIPDFGPQEGAEAGKRFMDEARIAATLDHPYLCPVYDVGEIDGHLYLTMAYIEGHSLKDTLRGEGLPQRHVAALVGKLALAMQEAHARKVIHRDLKPANIMIKSTSSGRVPVIVDFGLARRDDVEEVHLTRSGQIMGTLGYMAPEQIRGDLTAIGPSCDIYALGVILYELLTGRLPFSGPGLAIAGQVLTQTPPTPSSHRSDLDPRLEAICVKAIARKIEDRYASMSDFAAALTDFLNSPSHASTPSAPPLTSHAAAAGPAGSDTLVGQLFERVIIDPAPVSTVTTPQTVSSRDSIPDRRRPTWPIVITASALCVFLLGVILYVATDKGRIKIVIDDPRAVVTVDGGTVHIEEMGEPMTLRAGDHRLDVTWGDGQFETRSFMIRRGDNEELRVEYEPIRKMRSTARREPAKAFEPNPKPALGTDSTVSQTEATTSLDPEKAPPSVPEPGAAAELAIQRKDYLNSVGMKLALIPAGEFLMGSPDDDKSAKDDERPRHRVRITRPFYLGETEVTVGQFRHVVEATGFLAKAEIGDRVYWGWNEAIEKSEPDPKYNWRNPGFAQTDEHPVVGISWNTSIAFCNTLSGLEGFKPYYQLDPPAPLGGNGYRLPTEAEWEYACRAGTVTRFESGDDPESLATIGNTADGTARTIHPSQTWGISALDGYVYTAPVGRYRPNAFGLYDMHGNTKEWCFDSYKNNYYIPAISIDPSGPATAADRVIRGGSWQDGSPNCRSARRFGRLPRSKGIDCGFRIARSPADNENLRGKYERIRNTMAIASQKPEKAPQPESKIGSEADLAIAPKEITRAIGKKPGAARKSSRGGLPPKEITNSIGMRLRGISAGEFLMGSADSGKEALADEKPQHKVKITRPFYLGTTEVTVGQFRRVVEAAGYQTDAEKGGGTTGWSEAKGNFERSPKYTWRTPGFAQTDEHPVVCVSWNDAIVFCNLLSAIEGLKPYYQLDATTQSGGAGYRLPTEAEWEYACRAGTTTRFECGDVPESLAIVGNVADGTARIKYPGWIWAISARDGFVYTAPVGRFRPNAWGLYDMHGNVKEFCWDRYGSRYYYQSPGADPPGSLQEAERVTRGGCWHDSQRMCWSTFRKGIERADRGVCDGFRVARDTQTGR